MDGTSDLGLTAIDNLIAWDADGDDLVVVGQVERTTILDLCAAPGVAGYRRPARPRRSPSTRRTTASRSCCATCSRRHGLAPGEYELLPAGGIQERMQAVVEGRAAAGLLGPPFNRMAADAGCRVLGAAHEEFPALPGIGAVVRASLAPETGACGATRTSARSRRPRPGRPTSARSEAVAMLEAAGFDRAGAAGLFRHPRADDRAAARRHRAALRDAARPRDAAGRRAAGRGELVSPDGMTGGATMRVIIAGGGIGGLDARPRPGAVGRRGARHRGGAQGGPARARASRCWRTRCARSTASAWPIRSSRPASAGTA